MAYLKPQLQHFPVHTHQRCEGCESENGIPRTINGYSDPLCPSCLAVDKAWNRKFDQAEAELITQVIPAVEAWAAKWSQDFKRSELGMIIWQLTKLAKSYDVPDAN